MSSNCREYVVEKTGEIRRDSCDISGTCEGLGFLFVLSRFWGYFLVLIPIYSWGFFFIFVVHR